MTNDIRRWMRLCEAEKDTHSPLHSDAKAANPDPMDVPDYMSGRCHVFAIALHRAYGFGFLVLTDKSERYRGGTPAVHHVYAVDEKGNAYDCNGKHNAAEVVAQWLYIEPGSWGHRPGVDQIATEKGLQRFISDDWHKPLDGYTDADVQAALTVAQSSLNIR